MQDFEECYELSYSASGGKGVRMYGEEKREQALPLRSINLRCRIDSACPIVQGPMPDKHHYSPKRERFGAVVHRSDRFSSSSIARRRVHEAEFERERHDQMPADFGW
jgi:hypothetical protein